MIDSGLSAASKNQLSDDSWQSVLEAVDQTYAELVLYQQALEERNIELENLRNYLGSVLSSISDILIVCDRKGAITDLSRSLEALFKMPRGAIIGSDFYSYVNADDHNKIVDAIELAMQRQSPPTLEADICIDGECLPFEFNFTPLIDDRRRATGITIVGRPLGELRRAYGELEAGHAELKQAQAQLLHSEKLASLGRLLAGVAHELNNPISFVYANTHSLDRYLQKIERYFDEVHSGASRADLVALRTELKLDREIENMRAAIGGSRDGAERVRDIVEDLRRLSADGTGEVAEFDLVETSRTAAEWVLRGKDQKQILRFESDEKLCAQGRRGHIQQIIMNLVQNAYDAVEGVTDAQITINFDHDDLHAVLRVIDNGAGIAPEIATNIFDPFFTTKPVGKGTGLGLSISYKIAQENGGTLAFHARDEGSMFELRLPRGGQ